MEPARSYSPLPADPASPLFLQRAGQTLLIGYREDDRWVLARGWRRGDRLTDVRRWRFDTAARFITQVRRLVTEEAGRGEAAEATRLAGEWALTVETSPVG